MNAEMQNTSTRVTFTDAPLVSNATDESCAPRNNRPSRDRVNVITNNAANTASTSTR